MYFLRETILLSRMGFQLSQMLVILLGISCRLVGGTISWRHSILGGVRGSCSGAREHNNWRSRLHAGPYWLPRRQRFIILLFLWPLSRTGTGSSHFKNLRTGRSVGPPCKSNIAKFATLAQSPPPHRSSATRPILCLRLPKYRAFH